MTRPGPAPRRPWLARLQQTMTPVAIEDDGKPLTRPTVVEVACGLAWVAAAIFFFLGGSWLVTAGAQIDDYTANYVKVYGQAVNQCQSQVGGIGSAVPSTLATPTPTPASTDVITAGSELATDCRSITSATPDQDSIRSGARSAINTAVVLTLVLGVASAVGGWLLRPGNRWARRLLIGVVVISLAAAGLRVLTNALSLGATLFVVVSLLLVYIGKGGLYFARVALRRPSKRV